MLSRAKAETLAQLVVSADFGKCALEQEEARSGRNAFRMSMPRGGGHSTRRPVLVELPRYRTFYSIHIGGWNQHHFRDLRKQTVVGAPVAVQELNWVFRLAEQSCLGVRVEQIRNVGPRSQMEEQSDIFSSQPILRHVHQLIVDKPIKYDDLMVLLSCLGDCAPKTQDIAQIKGASQERQVPAPDVLVGTLDRPLDSAHSLLAL